MVASWEGTWGMGEKVKEVKKYKLSIIKIDMRCQIQPRKYNQYYYKFS